MSESEQSFPDIAVSPGHKLVWHDPAPLSVAQAAWQTYCHNALQQGLQTSEEAATVADSPDSKYMVVQTDFTLTHHANGEVVMRQTFESRGSDTTVSGYPPDHPTQLMCMNRTIQELQRYTIRLEQRLGELAREVTGQMIDRDNDRAAFTAQINQLQQEILELKRPRTIGLQPHDTTQPLRPIRRRRIQKNG